MKDINKILLNKNVTIKEAMKAIDIGAIKTALVIGDDNKLCGVVTDGDIRRGILRGVDIQEKVFDVMNKDFIYFSTDTPKEKILEQIKKKKIIGLPLVDKNKIVKNFVLLSEGENLSYINENPWQKKHLHRILVIGGAGFIGSILVRKLLSKGYKVNILDNFLYGTDSIKEIESNPNLKIIEGDTRHIEDVTLAAKDADAVVHLAELVGDPACDLNPSTTQEINYLATRIIADVCKYFQINRLIYSSSCSVYGESKGDGLLSEESSLNPVSLYAKMKIASEKALKEKQDTNFLPTILRFATVFGSSYRPRFDLVVNLLTAKAVKDGKITIFGGDQWRPNVHVTDIAEAILSVLEAPIEVVGGQIFNIGSEENNYTINQIGELIKKEVPSAELIIEEKEIDKRDYKVDFSKLRKTLNIELKKTVKDGILEIKKYMEKNSNIDYTDKKYSNIKFLKEHNNLI